MQFPTTVTILSFLAALTTASPTPVDLAPRCGTTLLPSSLQTLSESNPSLVSAPSSSFHVSQGASKTSRVFQLAIFQSIPAGSFGCQLNMQFPANYPIAIVGNGLLDVKTVFKDSPAQITVPNSFSWNNIVASGNALGSGIFGTVRPEQGTTKVINSEGCPVGGGNLAFVFEITDSVVDAASVDFTQAPGAGVFLTYNC